MSSRLARATSKSLSQNNNAVAGVKHSANSIPSRRCLSLGCVCGSSAQHGAYLAGLPQHHRDEEEKAQCFGESFLKDASGRGPERNLTHTAFYVRLFQCTINCFVLCNLKKKDLQYAISIYPREIDGIQKRGTGREEGRQGTVIHPAALLNEKSTRYS